MLNGARSPEFTNIEHRHKIRRFIGKNMKFYFVPNLYLSVLSSFSNSLRTLHIEMCYNIQYQIPLFNQLNLGNLVELRITFCGLNDFCGTFQNLQLLDLRFNAFENDSFLNKINAQNLETILLEGNDVELSDKIIEIKGIPTFFKASQSSIYKVVSGQKINKQFKTINFTELARSSVDLLFVTLLIIVEVLAQKQPRYCINVPKLILYCLILLQSCYKVCKLISNITNLNYYRNENKTANLFTELIIITVVIFQIKIEFCSVT
ncbi:Leucine-rich_repeat domain superfamily [Hexamita inflata]|uniref:Leucine-rich repeat domain superfamily n=1 Tax=Hexamita inflata TaxID=28002 RepID=A0AA86QEZ5_9EUKA|nr:Leucine-rich repeat domain superfamily [Hexamita inflata]